MSVATAYATERTTPKEQKQATEKLLIMLHSFRYLKAPFRQITQGKRNSGQQGKLFVAKPNRVLLTIQSPQKQLLLADGRFVWHVRYALQQIVRRNLVDNHPAFSLLAHNNQRQALEQFFVREAKQHDCLDLLTQLPKEQETQSACFVLQPEQATETEQMNNPQYILLYFVHQPSKGSKVATWQLQAMRFTTTIGSVTDVYLTLPLDYRMIDEQRFVFKPPEDFDVITDVPSQYLRSR